MRVIAGQFRSRRLHSSRGLSLRPTSDRLRETLFDILQPRIAGCFFIDAYAGTGAVGIEALSRGARRVVFLEKHKPTIALIQRNLRELGITKGFEIIAGDAIKSLEKLALGVPQRQGNLGTAAGTSGQPADILFFDPPYAETQEYVRVLAALTNSPLVGPGSLVILERDSHARILAPTYTLHPGPSAPLVLTRTVTQGDAALDFFALP